MKHIRHFLLRRPLACGFALLSGIFVHISVVAAEESALEAASRMPAASPAVAQFTLQNGMTLLVKPDHRAPTAVHMLWVRVGAMDEVDGTTGVAHVLEHMMFRGTPSVKAGDFSRRVAALGGRENAFTGKDYTGFYQQVPAAQLSAVMQLEADRFANNQWSDADFARELEVVKEERRLRVEDSPHARMQEALDAVMFQAAPYRRPAIGWMSDLEALTADEARAFYQRWYVSANAVIVVAGDVDPQAVLALAQTYYGSIPARPVPVRKPRAEPPQNGLRRLFFKAPAEQALVSLAFKIPSLSAAALETGQRDSASDDALALTVLAGVLSGYDNARLERALTQAPGHVADSVNAYCGLSGRGPQVCGLYGVVAPGKTAAQVEAALRAQVALVARDGVRSAELQRVKNQWLAGTVYEQDSVFNQARLLGVNWIDGLPVDAEEKLMARLREVSAAQVQSVAARYFGDDDLTVATLLPQPIDHSLAPRPPIPGLRH